MSTAETADRLAEMMRDMNKTLQFCSDHVRYDLQRNLIQVIEELLRKNPHGMGLFKSVREVAEMTVESYKGRGQVHVALRRISNVDNDAALKGDNVFSFGGLRQTFQRHAEADKFLVDRMLAKRDDKGELSLSKWGEYVLSYLDKKQDKNVDNVQRHKDISPQ